MPYDKEKDKVLHDIEKRIILWNEEGLTLSFTEDSLREAGWPYENFNVFDLRETFSLNVTVETVSKSTVRFLRKNNTEEEYYGL